MGSLLGPNCVISRWDSFEYEDGLCLMKWFYVIDGSQTGPVTEPEFAVLISNGTVRAETLVWREGMSEWQAAGSACPGFFSGEVAMAGGLLVGGAGKEETLQRMREGVKEEGGVSPGGFWVRVVAKMVDNILLMIPGQLVLGLLGFSESLASAKADPSRLGLVMKVMVIQSLVGVVLAANYNGWMVARYGATVGKMLVGLKVVRAGDLAPLGFGRAFGRYFAELLNGLTLGIGYAMVVFRADKRALHDLIAGTQVIRSR